MRRPACRTRCGAAGKLHAMDVVVALQDFEFLGGSLGMAAGEAIIAGMTQAVERKTPFIIFTASAARACRKACSR